MENRQQWIRTLVASRPTRRAAAAGACVVALLSAVARPASGFCQARTCDRATENCARDQNGCVVSGAPLVWNRSVISVSVDPAGSARLGITGEQTAAVLQRAFDNWQEVTCASGQRPALSLSISASPAGTMNDADAIVTYVDAGWRYPSSNGAVTELAVDPDTGSISHALLQINSQTHPLAIDAQAPAIDLEAVLTHEVGHLIGLDHSRVPGATMVAEAQAFGTPELRSLDADDIAGVCSLYPFRTPKPRSSDSDSSCAASSTAPTAAGTQTLACCLIGAVWLLAARRRAARSGALAGRAQPSIA